MLSPVAHGSVIQCKYGSCIKKCTTEFHSLTPTARCALYYKMCHFSVQRILTRGSLRTPVVSPALWRTQALSLPTPIKTYHRFITHRIWRTASPPVPNHPQTIGCLIANYGSLQAPLITPWLRVISYTLKTY